jgi:MFS family permease
LQGACSKDATRNLLFGGQTVSVIGDALYAVALLWLILSNRDNAQDLGIVLTAYGIPRAGSMLLGSWLSDRLRPRRPLKPVWSGRSSFRVAGSCWAW